MTKRKATTPAWTSTRDEAAKRRRVEQKNEDIMTEHLKRSFMDTDLLRRTGLKSLNDTIFGSFLVEDLDVSFCLQVVDVQKLETPVEADDANVAGSQDGASDSASLDISDESGEEGPLDEEADEHQKADRQSADHSASDTGLISAFDIVKEYVQEPQAEIQSAAQEEYLLMAPTLPITSPMIVDSFPSDLTAGSSTTTMQTDIARLATEEASRVTGDDGPARVQAQGYDLSKTSPMLLDGPSPTSSAASPASACSETSCSSTTSSLEAPDSAPEDQLLHDPAAPTEPNHKPRSRSRSKPPTQKPSTAYCYWANKPSGCKRPHLCTYSHALLGVPCPSEAQGAKCMKGHGCFYKHSDIPGLYSLASMEGVSGATWNPRGNGVVAGAGGSSSARGWNTGGRGRGVGRGRGRGASRARGGGRGRWASGSSRGRGRGN